MSSPIAIVGQGCVLPGALTPEELWQGVVEGRDLTSSVSPGRWGLARSRALGTTTDHADRSWSDRGGYVSGFAEVFEPGAYDLPIEQVQALDPLVQWLLHSGRQALEGLQVPARCAVVLGNLSFPSEAMARFAERHWLGPIAEVVGLEEVDPVNRFMSGLSATLVARALGLEGPAFAMDAACASSLYAIKLACDALRDGDVDLALSGAVSRSDDLFIHVGFCALQAMSKTGQSRPFHAGADGLVPAEGAGVVALMRLEDAEQQGLRVLGVIRGIGLSNDGRTGGFLAPSKEGQVRAIRAAYGQGLDPSEVGLVECHATGTPVGDGTELASMREVFPPGQAIGSLKSNLGHLITAAGVAGLIKVLKAFEHGVKPPNRRVDDRHEALDGFELIEAPVPWTGPRTAAISAFGFGGNNAHVVVSASAAPTSPEPRAAGPIAVVGLGASVGSGTSVRDFAAALSGGAHQRVATEVVLPLRELKFPPKDLEQTLPQQLLVLRAVREALHGLDLPRETSVLVGMGADAEIGRYGARWRVAEWASELSLPESWIAEAREAFVPVLQAAGVVGTMPNIPANRVNANYDLAGPSWTISAEELSGLRSLEVAVRMLRAGEAEAAVVAAVDLSAEPVHLEALSALAGDRTPGDGAVALALMPLATAEARGLEVFAVLDEGEGVELPVDIESIVGHIHAAEALVRVVAAVVLGRTGALCGPTVVSHEALLGQTGSIALIPRVGPLPEPPVDEAPLFRMPAHPPLVVLPELPAMDTDHLLSPLSPASGTMAHAPVLPPVLDAPAAPSITESVSEPLAPVLAPPHPLPVGRDEGVLSEAMALRERMARVHAAFLQQQADAHATFLRLREAQSEALLAAATSAPTAPVAPLATVAPAAIPPTVVPPPAPAVVPPAPAVREELTDSPTRRPEAPPRSQPRGPTWDREGLLVHSSGDISEIFGAEFRQQDGYLRQTRMPEPPLLLADRVVGLDAEPGSMKKGTIWTETDVRWDSWYLHEARMPAGLMIESGQADLMLISYLGVDFLNRSDRIYRLLGCELTYHGPLPRPGETLLYDIHVDGHANQGPVRLFFFHYDCHVDGLRRLSVRGGQAGFFTEEELLSSGGILWEPETGERVEDPRLDGPAIPCDKATFARADLEAFADGRTWDCFGPGFERSKTHTRTPRIAAGRMLFLQEVTGFDLQGGPWGRGYLRAIDDIAPDDWFFDGHFKNDPCMPGTLMFEGCLQAMAVYMAALGYTVDRDGWRFEPVPEQKYLMRCRGQVTPTSRQLIYEVFIEEVIDGPVPTLYADLLCTVITEDGTPMKAFHCRRMGIQLSPGWPMDSRPEVIDEASDTAAICHYQGAEHRLDHDALVACAWGRPSRAFGPMYEKFDGVRKVPRLPGPPYHFCTRVLDVQGPMGQPKAGARVVMAYEVPPDAWYFHENGAATMPYAVLLEAALQPCGWLASYVGCTLDAPHDLFFRNLDGTGTQHLEVLPNAGTLVTTAKLGSVSLAGGMTIVGFEVEVRSGEDLVFDMKTVFGFFPAEALAAQAGLPPDNPEWLEATGEPVDFGGVCRDYLRNIGQIQKIAENTFVAATPVDPENWYFRAHFCQDPVQPGSLGIEAMLQLLQAAMLHEGLAEGLEDARFEPVALSEPLTWKYRGQVLPHNELVHCTLHIDEVVRGDAGVLARATASLWVDGMRIYEARNVGMRVVGVSLPRPAAIELLQPEGWVADHCPTHTLPSLPMAYLLDRIAAAATDHAEGQRVIGLRDVKVKRWVVVTGETALEARVARVSRGLRVLLLDAGEVVAEGRALLAWDFQQGGEANPPLAGDLQADPYEDGRLFHGPSFQLLKRLVTSPGGASSLLDAAVEGVPRGVLHPALLDAATHGIPHDGLEAWDPSIPEGMVAYPAFVPSLDLHGPVPSGEIRCEVRFAGFHAGVRELPSFEIQLVVDDQVWCRYRLVEALFPKGPIGRAEPRARRDFLRGRYAEGVSLSRVEGDTTVLDADDVAGSDWLPGTVEAVFGSREPGEIAAREHLGRVLGVHPRVARSAAPLSRFELSEGLQVETLSESLDTRCVRDFWTEWFERRRWPVEDLYYGLIERFVRRVVTPDPEALSAVSGRSLLYLGNHQVGLESLLFSVVAGGLNGVPTVTLAKSEHRDSWLGTLIRLCFSYPGIRDPGLIEYFDRQDKASLVTIIGQLAQEMMGPGKSVMVHVEGTRSLECRTPVEKMSGAFLDMAMKVNAPVVPVRFVGGLPGTPLESRVEFPVDFGKQDIWIGTPILPETLASMPYGERKKLVIEAINDLGPDNSVEEPLPGDPDFGGRVAAWSEGAGVNPDNAALREVLAECREPCDQTRALLAGVPDGDWLRALSERIGTGVVG
ncbi:MAG TPA: beta-ketoacyl synthase N-terminal-like domain-containing protein [Myxococcota bacterium]|nr:beta-ketoacyl synthase N-terminal-like domain-containing protein [Myxococcota bacterium]